MSLVQKERRGNKRRDGGGGVREGRNRECRRMKKDHARKKKMLKRKTGINMVAVLPRVTGRDQLGQKINDNE